MYSLKREGELTSAGKTQWYAVYTRSRHERVVSQQLQLRGVRTFLPLVNEIHRWKDRKKNLEIPLFPGYTFVNISTTSEDRVRVLRVDGVVSFVGVRGEGTPIPETQIATVRELVTKAKCAPHPFLEAGQRVRIRGGCLDGIEGIFVAHNGDRNIVVSIEAIHRSVAMRLEEYEVEPI